MSAQVVAPAPEVALLKVVRVARGLTQAELATRADLARPTISRIETHVEVPRARTAQRLASVLAFPVEELFPAVYDGAPADNGRSGNEVRDAGAQRSG